MEKIQNGQLIETDIQITVYCPLMGIVFSILKPMVLIEYTISSFTIDPNTFNSAEIETVMQISAKSEEEADILASQQGTVKKKEHVYQALLNTELLLEERINNESSNSG